MIKIQRHIGTDIICQGLSSDNMREGWMLCQLPDGEIEEIYIKNIKHISAYEN